MKIVSMTCPNCGATLQVDANNKNVTCNYCGNSLFIDDETSHVKIDNPEQVGYQFEKGRQRAQAEQQYSQPNMYVQPSNYTQPKKRRTWLWVLGWICIFPLPLTIILIRKKDMKPILKYGIIAVAWILYLIIGLAGNGNKNNTTPNSNSSDVSITETETNDKQESNTAPDLQTLQSFFDEFNQSGNHDNLIDLTKKYGLFISNKEMSLEEKEYFKVALTEEDAQLKSNDDLSVDGDYVVIKFDSENNRLDYAYLHRIGDDIHKEIIVAVETLVGTFNETSETQLVFAENFVPSDSTNSHYRHEFRLNAYSDAIGKSYAFGDEIVDTVAHTDIFNGMHIRVYSKGISINAAIQLLTNVSPILDKEISDETINEAIDYINEHKSANGYYFGNLGLVLLGSDANGYDFMLKQGND